MPKSKSQVNHFLSNTYSPFKFKVLHFPGYLFSDIFFHSTFIQQIIISHDIQRHKDIVSIRPILIYACGLQKFVTKFYWCMMVWETQRLNCTYLIHNTGCNTEWVHILNWFQVIISDKLIKTFPACLGRGALHRYTSDISTYSTLKIFII